MLKIRHLVFFIGSMLTVILILLFFTEAQNKNTILQAEEVLQDIGLSSEKMQGFIVNKYFFDERESVTKLVLKSSQNVLRIESISNIDKTSADILLEDEILTIHALYGGALSPYPGEISQQIVCNERFQPEFNTKQTARLNYSYFILFATDRFTYGACSEDLVKYKAILAWTYCAEKNTFYRFEFFSPIETNSESYLDLVTSFTCGLSN